MSETRENKLIDHYAPLEGHLAIARHLLSDAYALLDTVHQDPAVTVLKTEVGVFLGITDSPGVEAGRGEAGHQEAGEGPRSTSPTD